VQGKQRRKRAVGLGYEHGKDQKPHLVTKGEGVVAEEILRQARANQIPVTTDTTGLVDTLFRLDYMQDIPEELFAVVAEILVFAYESMGRGLGEDDARRPGP